MSGNLGSLGAAHAWQPGCLAQHTHSQRYKSTACLPAPRAHNPPLPQVLSAFWQSSGAAFRAVAVLQRQPGLWAHLTALLEAGGQAGALSLPAPRGAEADQATAAAAWAEQEPAAALLQAEAHALQIAAAECYTWAASGGAAAPGMPAELAAFLRKLPAELAPRLLERYCLPLPSAPLLAAAQQASAAGGLQLLGAALSDEALWRSMAEGGGLTPQLAAAAQPLLAQLGSQGEAARVLADGAPAIAARNFGAQPSAVAIAQASRCRCWRACWLGCVGAMPGSRVRSFDTASPPAAHLACPPPPTHRASSW